MAQKKRKMHSLPPQKRRVHSARLDLHQELFWVSLGIVFVASLLGVLLHSETTLTGHATVQTIAFLKEGQRVYIEVNDVIGVAEAIIDVTETVKGATITIQQDDSIADDRPSFSKFTISSNEQTENFGKVEWAFKIKEFLFFIYV